MLMMMTTSRMTMLKVVTSIACLINLAMAGRVVPRQATNQNPFRVRGGGYTYREPSLRHRQLPHPMHHGHGGTSYLGCLNYTNAELQTEWKFSGRAPSCSYVSHGTNYEDDDDSYSGGGGGGGDDDAYDGYGYDDAYSGDNGDDNAAANGDDDENGGGNGGGGGGDGDDAYSGDQADDYYVDSYDYDDQYYAGGNDDYNKNGNGNDGRNSGNNNNNGDGYNNGDRADSGYQVNNEDIADGNNDNNENPMLSFNISECNTYNNLWVWDLAFSCESDKSLDNCECTFAEQLMDQEMLQCNDIEKCPKNCPVCETCFKLVGCAPVPDIFTKTGVSASTLFAIFAAIGLFAFGVGYYYCRNRKKGDENSFEAHLIDKELQDAIHKVVGPPPPPQQEQGRDYDPETMLGPYPDVPDFKSDLSSLDSRATMESGNLLPPPPDDTNANSNTRIPDQINVSPSAEEVEVALDVVVKQQAGPILTSSPALPPPDVPRIFPPTKASLLATSSTAQAPAPVATKAGASTAIVPTASIEAEKSATSSDSSPPEVPNETVPSSDSRTPEVPNETVPVPGGMEGMEGKIGDASVTKKAVAPMVASASKETPILTSSTAPPPPDVPRIFPPTKASLLATSSTAQAPVPVATKAGASTAIVPTASVATNASTASASKLPNPVTSIAPTASAASNSQLPSPVTLKTTTSTSSIESPDLTPVTNSTTSDAVIGSSTAAPPKETTTLPPPTTSNTSNAPPINSSTAVLPKESKILPLPASSKDVLPNETQNLPPTSPTSLPMADAPSSPKFGMSVRNKGKEKGEESSTADAATDNNAEDNNVESLSPSPVIKYDFISPKASTDTNNENSIAASYSQDLRGDPSYASTYYEEAEATGESILESDVSRSEESETPWIGDIDLSYTEPSFDDNQSAESRHSDGKVTGLGKQESKEEEATAEPGEPTNVWLIPLKDLEQLEEDPSTHDSKKKPLTEAEKAAAEKDPSVVWLAPASSPAELAPEPKDDDASGSGSSWGPDDAGPWLAPI